MEGCDLRTRGQVPIQLYGKEAKHYSRQLDQGMKVTELHFIIESRVPEAELNCFTVELVLVNCWRVLATSQLHFIRPVRLSSWGWTH